MFGTWGNAAAGINSNPLTFTITNAAPVVSALFTPLTGGKASLTIQTIGRGRVQASPAANIYTINATVNLIAIADAGQQFQGWSGDVSGSNTNLSLTMNQSKTVIAMFSHTPSVSANAPLNGMFNSGFRLMISSDFGAAWIVQSSTNLSNWYPLVTITNTYGRAQFTDAAGVTNNATFYRLLSSP